MKTTRTDELRGYRLDFTHNKLILNEKFAKAAFTDYGSPENLRMKDILADFPNLAVSVEKGRNITTTRPTKRLNYKNMEKYIRAHDNSDALLIEFETVKARSKTANSPYKYVRDWFVTTFPNYSDGAMFRQEKENDKKPAEQSDDAGNETKETEAA